MSSAQGLTWSGDDEKCIKAELNNPRQPMKVTGCIPVKNGIAYVMTDKYGRKYVLKASKYGQSGKPRKVYL